MAHLSGAPVSVAATSGYPLIAWLWWLRGLCSWIPEDCTSQREFLLDSIPWALHRQQTETQPSLSVKEACLLVLKLWP